MTKNTIAGILFALVAFAGNSFAQDADASSSYVYATYFECSPQGESRADEIINTSFTPHYNAAVEQGDIQSWSWLQHFVGGQWRRVLVIVAGDINSLLDASGALGEIISDQTPEAGRAFSAICASHEDYIWQTASEIGAPAVTTDRGAAGFSVYMNCDLNGEERVDELMSKVFAPIYNKHVGEGELTSWNWLKHYVGGEWRRLLIMGAADHKTLLATREAIFAEFEDRKVERAVKELNAICATHQDYMWDVLVQNP